MPVRQNSGLLVCALLLIGLTALGLSLPHPAAGQFGIGYGTALDEFVALTCAQAVVYGAAVWMLLRAGEDFPLGRVLAVAALLRLMVLVFPPFLSNDMYRYVWDGWVQARSINPYRYIPADPHLAFLRDAIIYPNINRANYAHTIYPPAAEMLFLVITRIGAWLSIPPVLMMKLGMVGLEALGIWAMARLAREAGLPASRVLIYAWNPLPVWEFAGSGHVDAIAVCFVALALLAATRGKSIFSAAALAVAVLTKFLPLALLPAIWRRWDWIFALVFAALIILFYTPYISVGTGVFGFLGGYAHQEHLASGSGIFLLGLANVSGAGTKLYFAAFALLLLALAIFMIRHPASNAQTLARRASLLIGLLMLCLSPHYPWYYAWALIPSCIAVSPACLYLASASFLLYLNPTHTKLFWPAFMFLPFAALGLWELTQSRALPEGAKA